MITPIISLLAALFCFTCTARAADDALNGGLGRGEHFPYKLKHWYGKEHVVTRLSKAGEVYEFVRVSKVEFQVRQAGDTSEVLFRFNVDFNDGGVIRTDGRLIDILKTEAKVTALLYGDRGYFLIEASKNAPKLSKGQIYIIPKPIHVHNWHRTFMAPTRDYYRGVDNVRYPISGKVASARILDTRKIEFVYLGPSEEIGNPDVFRYDGDTLFKNEKEHVKKAVVTYCITDDKSWISNLESALQDKDRRLEYLKNYDKSELLAAFSNASDPEIHKKLAALVEELYPPAKK